MKRFELLVFLILLLCTIPVMVYCQWSTDPNENTLVCNAEEDQREPAIITDGNGGVFISWRDYRYNNSIFGGDIMVQRLSNEGLALWIANGIAVNAEGEHSWAAIFLSILIYYIWGKQNHKL
ncbi:MAG: hypothetical protein U5K32_09025 [Bacteroidales bacterium]|nr:hypothetical protein [Bacteroidales bacterium]